ncbi:MAG TPA: alpha-ketoglutarate-dependent dioxygenase AlkB [Xanthomonadales bacterium]|nr:alpha-ketoglutarate-dependent dioxygenase AlkB [Xanthomonadales bacterium]
MPGIDYRPAFLRPGEAQALLPLLWQELPWKQQDLVLFGKAVRQPRLTAWCSDPDVSYRYSGLTLPAAAWHPALLELRERLQVALERPFNSVLANAYRDGQDSMGWHADDEAELGSEPCIACISLGAVRQFRLRPRQPVAAKQSPLNIGLEPGSLLIMSGDSQRCWQHAVPKTRRLVGLRISLTYRLVRQ